MPAQLPAFVIDNPGDGALMYLILLCKLALCCVALAMLQSDAVYLQLRQRSKVAFFASADVKSSFVKHISRVVGLRAEKQMVRIYTGRIITHMQNTKARRDLSAIYHPGSTVSPHVLAV